MNRLKIFIVITVIIVLLIGCGDKHNMQNIETTTTETTTAPSVTTTAETTESTTVPVETIPSFAEVNSDIEAFFRVFYANSKDSYFRTEDLGDEGYAYAYAGGEVTGYFGNNSLEYSYKSPLYRLDVRFFGESGTAYYEYYIINDNLIYLVRNDYDFWPYQEETYEEYYIFNGKIWKYNIETDNLVELIATDEIIVRNYPENLISIYEVAKKALFQSSETTVVQIIHALPNKDNLFNQFNKVKNSFFRKFYFGNYYSSKGGQADFPEFTAEYNNVFGLYDDTKLYKLKFFYTEKTTYAKYECYIIDDTNIYIIAKKEEYIPHSDGLYFDKNYFKEYFIVNGKVMKYNTEKQDLVESIDDSNIFVYFNLAKEALED